MLARCTDKSYAELLFSFFQNMGRSLSGLVLAASRRPKAAPKSYAPAAGSVPNVASVSLVKNFGNTRFTEQLQAAVSATDQSGNAKLQALKAGFEADAVKQIDCDDVWAGIKEAEGGGEANPALRNPVSAIRNDIRANYGFGQKMKALATQEKTARLGYATALIADMAHDDINPSRITANNLIKECSSMAEAKKQLDAMREMGVEPNDSTDLTLLHVAYESGDQKAIDGLIKKLQGRGLNDHETKVFANIQSKYAAPDGHSAKAEE